MNDFSFSEGGLAEIPVEGFQGEVFAPQLQVEDAARATGLEPASEIGQQHFKMMDMVEPPPVIGSNLDFGDALEVYDTLEDGPARFALFNELDKWEQTQVLENYQSPLGERERKEAREKIDHLDALGMDWKAHPEARKKVVEAYGEEWTQAFEATPDEHKGRLCGEKVLEEFYSKPVDREVESIIRSYSKPGDKDADSMIRFLSSVDAPEGIRGSKDVWRVFMAPLIPRLQKEINKVNEIFGLELQIRKY